MVTGTPVPEGELRTAGFRFAIAIYHLPTAASDPTVAARELLAGKAIELRASMPDAIPPKAIVVVSRPALRDFAPPSPTSLTYFARGLSDEQKTALQKSQEVTVLSFAGPARDAFSTYKAATSLVLALAKRVGGILWDDESRLAFTAESWSERLEGWNEEVPYVGDHIAIHAYRDGELYRLVTLGMAKLALPDVAVNQVPASDDAMSRLVNWTCQALAERSAVGKSGRLRLSIDAIRNRRAREALGSDILDGGTRAGEVVLANGEPHEGDAENRLIDIVFPGPAASLHERQHALLAQLFGSKDGLVKARASDEELLEASKRAKATVLQYKERFKKGSLGVERLMVKAPFEAPDGETEFMWVEVTRWEDKTLHGVLQNDPFRIPGLKSGALVTIDEAVIYDYIHVSADGGREGNETGAILKKRGQ